jgi:hypothetical protein
MACPNFNKLTLQLPGIVLRSCFESSSAQLWLNGCLTFVPHFGYAKNCLDTAAAVQKIVAARHRN